MSDVSYAGPLSDWLAQAPQQPPPRVMGKSPAKLLAPYLDPDQAQSAAEAAATRVRAPYAKANARESGLPQIGEYFGNKLASALTAPRDALTGTLQVTDPETGMPTREAMERGQSVTNLAMTGGVPFARQGAAGMAGGRLIQPSLESPAMKLYRGESAYNKGGNFYTTDPEWARQFTHSGRIEEVRSHDIDPGHVYDPPNPVYAGDPDAVDAAIAEAKKLKMKAVRLDEGAGQPQSVFVFNKTALKGPRKFGPFEEQQIVRGATSGPQMSVGAPERIVGASYTAAGKHYVAPNHVLAMDQAVKDLGLSGTSDLVDLHGGFEGHHAANGFMTSTGRVVNRAEADRIAAAAEQGQSSRPGSLKSEDMKTGSIAALPAMNAYHYQDKK